MPKMHALGEYFATLEIHTGGLRSHALSKLTSALYHHRMIVAAAYPRPDVIRNDVLFARTVGIVLTPTSAYAAHDAMLDVEASR